MSLKIKALKKSLWVYHMSGGSCNNCDIEILACLDPRFDIERFGMTLVGSPRHADVLLCTGIINKKCVERVKEVYAQTAKPCVVVAIGACSCSGGIFRDGYQMGGPLDKLIPVDIYIPGCPPKPEAMIAGIVKLLEKLK
ncbi:MAG: NADH-quinone oxidoreductase subunit NuoB [Candidatus Omnitrophica bacterium]|nr:NADH-quinone oxidoreductase subunit NuoB [Candidatus Omnitrophota bacterium]